MLGQGPPPPTYFGNVLQTQMAGGRRAYEGANAAGTTLGSVQDDQQAALGMYANAAAGNGPSVAQAQLQAQGEADQRQAMRMAAGARGGNMAGQYRGAMLGAQAQQNATREQLATLRAQEQQAAMQGYASLGNAQAAQAMQQQMQYEQLGLGYAGQSMEYDMHRRQQALAGKNARFARGTQIYDRGVNMAGNLLGAVGGL